MYVLKHYDAWKNDVCRRILLPSVSALASCIHPCLSDPVGLGISTGMAPVAQIPTGMAPAGQNTHRDGIPVVAKSHRDIPVA